MNLKEQLLAIHAENIDKYPKAAEWILEKADKLTDCPDGFKYKIGWIRWYREDTGCGLQEAIDEYGKRHYGGAEDSCHEK